MTSVRVTVSRERENNTAAARVRLGHVRNSQSTEVTANSKRRTGRFKSCERKRRLKIEVEVPVKLVLNQQNYEKNKTKKKPLQLRENQTKTKIDQLMP